MRNRINALLLTCIMASTFFAPVTVHAADNGSSTGFTPISAIITVIAFFTGAAVTFVIVRRAGKRELRESLDKAGKVIDGLERIIGTAPVAFMLSIDGVVIKTNGYASKHLGMEVGTEARKYYADRHQRERIIQIASKDTWVENQIIKCYIANGDIHRFLANIIQVEYEEQEAYILWAMDIEENEAQKDLLDVSQKKYMRVKERLEQIISAAPISYLLSDGGKIVEINESMKKDIGLDVGGIFRSVFEDPSERDTIQEIVMRKGVSRNNIVKLKFSDGKLHRCLLNAASTDFENRSALVIWMIDVERTENHKDQLVKAQQNMQAILDFLPLPVRITDLETGNIAYFNNAALELFGIEIPGQIIGKPATDLIPDDTNTVLMANNAGMDRPFTSEFVCVKPNGERLDMLVTDCVIDYNGRKASLGIMEDLTTAKEYQRMLVSTAEKEKEANELKGRFLVNMSHEIRTPMNAIIGLTEIEMRKENIIETLEIYKKINSSAKNLLNIINDILDISKIEADKMELYDDEFELEEVIGSAILVVTPRLDGKNVEFMLNQSLTLPRFVVGDRTRLWQILKNFLDNAAKYTENGKIVLSIFENRNLSDDETIYITFIVEDTGLGIGEEQMKKLFMPYEQFYNNAQKKYTGTGLGMAISKQLCELMGGNMQIESVEGKGTTIFITIPFSRSENNETEMQAVRTPLLTGVSVLAVDDDDISLGIMEALLESSDATCTIAHSGEEAMDIIFDRRDKGESFDIILLDYMMNGINGMETARQIQAGLSESPKLLMVTAYQRLLLKPEIEKNGISGIIEKPFIPSQFIHKLCMALGFESPENSAEAESGFVRFTDVQVLLCEDYRLNQEVATGMFAQFGVIATIAEDGKQGIEILEDTKDFDLIFMDLKMPVMDGYEATSIIRGNPKFDHIPIISLTADAMKESIDKCLRIGMDDHIAKPIEFDKLHGIFVKWLPESKQERMDKAVWTGKKQSNDGLTRFGGKKDLYEKALRDFAKDLPDEWPDFNDAISKIEETLLYIHKIKGAAGNLSEEYLYRYASELEASLRGDNPERESYDRLVKASDAYKRRIAIQLKENNEAPKEAGSDEEFSENLTSLKEALRDFDLRKGTKAVNVLKMKTWPSVDAEILDQLYKHMQSYDYVSALDVLESIQK